MSHPPPSNLWAPTQPQLAEDVALFLLSELRQWLDQEPDKKTDEQHFLVPGNLEKWWQQADQTIFGNLCSKANMIRKVYHHLTYMRARSSQRWGGSEAGREILRIPSVPLDP